jgi:hypothetical protein
MPTLFRMTPKLTTVVIAYREVVGQHHPLREPIKG